MSNNNLKDCKAIPLDDHDDGNDDDASYMKLIKYNYSQAKKGRNKENQ